MPNLLFFVTFTFLFTLGISLLLTIAYFSRPRYKKVALLTEAEKRFFNSVKRAVPDTYSIFAQVRLANVVGLRNSEIIWTHFNPLGAKCLDFVLYDNHTGETALVIELDDKSHRQKQRLKRDKFIDSVLAKVGIPIIHQKCVGYYDLDELRLKIEQALKQSSFS